MTTSITSQNINVELPEAYQAEDLTLKVSSTIDGQPLKAVQKAEAALYSKGVKVASKTLNAGIEFNEPTLTIRFNEADTANLSGLHQIECLVRDIAGNDAFILKGTIFFNKTLTRLQ